MFYHQKVARVRVFADIQNFALRAYCVHAIPIDRRWPSPSGITPAHCRILSHIASLGEGGGEGRKAYQGAEALCLGAEMVREIRTGQGQM